MPCTCGNPQNFEECCEPYLKGTKLPPTAEALMRSRYSAFAKADMAYLKKTLAPESRKDFDEKQTQKWAEEAKWKKLKIIATKKGTAEDLKGTVEFSAFYEIEGGDVQHHEVSTFRKDEKGQWLFIDGDAHTHAADEDAEHAHMKIETVVRTEDKVGRNDPCKCGSGKKFKKCCG